MKTSLFKRTMSLLLALVALFSLATPAFAAATTAFDILSDSKYAKTYTLASSGKTIPYTDSGLNHRGTATYGRSSSSYIANNTDELYIMDVGINSKNESWAKVSYPAGSKRVIAYIALSAVTANNSNHAKTVSSGKFYCSLRSNTSASSSYYVAKGDTVYLVATSGDKYQILYPISGGKWRLAWCAKSDYQKYCGGAAATTSDGLIDVTAYLAGKTIYLRSVENGKYLCADANYSGNPTMCNRNSATTWTVFTVTPMTSDGWVGLIANTNGKYLSANLSKTDAPIRAESNQMLSWECFRIYLKGNDFYLKAQANGKWLCVRVDKSGAPLQAYANGASTWERFDITFRKQSNFIKPAELINSAVENGISAGSNAFHALLSINTKYADSLTSSDKGGTTVYMFEGVGNNSSASARMNAMGVVVKNGDIVYLNRNCSTIPDYPFTPSKNDWTPMPTLKSGIYSFTTVNHRDQYAALNVSGATVVRFRSQYDYYNSTSSGINVHRRSTDYIAPANKSWVNSAGCLLIGNAGTGNTSEYARFIQVLEIVPSGARGDAKYSNWKSGKIIVDRTYAYDYLVAVGYPADAIRAIG